MNNKKFIGIIVACVIVVGVVAAVAIRTPTKDDPKVAFADPKLEGAVMEAIDIPEDPIYASNLETLIGFVAYGMNITDLAGLEHYASVMQLSLSENQISDISPLAGLAKLTSLHLWENQISDISPLVQNAGLGAGDEVWLEYNPLSSDSINTYIPELEARGVTVYY